METPPFNPINLNDPELQSDYDRLQRVVRPTDVLGDSDRSGGIPDDALGTDQAAGDGDSIDLFDPSFFGITEADFHVAGMADEDDSDSPSPMAPQLANAEKHYLPFARKREGRQALKKVTIEDFDTREERISFLAVEKHKIDLFGHKAKTDDRKSAVRWFFCQEDHGGLTFDMCCDVLESRPDVVRLRIHYEFWLRWMVFPYEFPFMTVPVPAILRPEILFYAGEYGLEVAQEAWMQPGINAEGLLTKAAGVSRLSEVPKDYTTALDLLEAKYLMSPQHDGWYLTGRNPLLQRLDIEKHMGRNMGLGTTTHWSRMFVSAKG